MRKSVDFYYDIVCPYAYLASLQIEEVAFRCNIHINWKPVLLGGIYKAIQSPQQPSHVWPSSKLHWNQLDLQRQVKKIEADFVYNPNHPQRTVEIMRLLSICPETKRAAMSHRLFKAYWVDKTTFPNNSLLQQIAVEFSLPPSIFESQEAKKLLYKNTDEAIKKGLFGVPTFTYEKQVLWGQDRLFFIAEHFLEKKTKWPQERKTAATIQFYHDFASPFSFLAAMNIEKIAKRYEAKVNYIPILLGALFKSIGTPIVPIATMPSVKQKYLFEDIKRWAKWWGTEFKWPKHFPMRTVLPLRVSIVLPQSIQEIYKAYWIRGEDISTKEVLSPIIINCGASPDEIFKRCETIAIKEELKSNTKQAEVNNICGVPSFQIDNQMWWGQDRLNEVAKYLHSMES